MKLPAWLTGPKLPPPWDRAESIEGLRLLTGCSRFPEFEERAGELYDARIGDTRNPLVIAAEIVEILRKEFL